MILVICSDLFFKAKISETAKQLNQKIEFADSEPEVLSKIAAQKIQKIIIDLNDGHINALELIQKIRALDPKIEVIGFLSHVQTELRKNALEAGFSMVVARSEFSRNLPAFLKV